MFVNVAWYVSMVVNLTWYVSEEGEDDVEDKVATTSSHHQNLLLQCQFKVSFSFFKKRRRLQSYPLGIQSSNERNGNIFSFIFLFVVAIV